VLLTPPKKFSEGREPISGRHLLETEVYELIILNNRYELSTAYPRKKEARK
jgi:hypothetical protein